MSDIAIDQEAPPAPPEYVPPRDDDVEGLDPEDLNVAGPPELDDEEIIEPKVLPIMRVITSEKGDSAEYLQRPLTYFLKLELYGLLARGVKVVMADENGLGINDIMDMAKPQNVIEKMMQLPGADTAPDSDEDNQVRQLEEASKMMAAFAQVVSVAPELLYEAYCIVLQAPKGHRKWLIDWGLPNIPDEMGEDILDTFVDQNWGVMRDFFFKYLPKLFKRMAQANSRHASTTAPSKL